MKSVSKRGNVRASSMRMARAPVRRSGRRTLRLKRTASRRPTPGWRATRPSKKRAVSSRMPRSRTTQPCRRFTGSLRALMRPSRLWSRTKTRVSASLSRAARTTAGPKTTCFTRSPTRSSIQKVHRPQPHAQRTSGARTSRSTRRTRARWAKWVRPSPDVSRTRTRRSALRSSKPFLVPTSVTSRARTEWFLSRSRSPSLSRRRGTSP